MADLLLGQQMLLLGASGPACGSSRARVPRHPAFPLNSLCLDQHLLGSTRYGQRVQCMGLKLDCQDSYSHLPPHTVQL